jgi:hypothetical protein
MVNMNVKPIFLAIGVFLGTCGGSPLHAAEQQDDKKEEPAAQILTADIDRTYQDGKMKNAFVIKGKSNLNIKKANVVSEGEGDSSFIVYLTTDEFPAAVGSTLLVKVKDKIFLPHSYGGDAKAYWSLELRDVDRASAEILNGSPLPKAPKDSFTVEYWPHQKSYPVASPVRVGITLTNVGKVPLTIYWGTHGGGNYPCRDTQLSFTATLDGVAVAANPKPLPDGFISSPFVSKPNSDLKRSEDLTQWLQFKKPGKYLIEATYTVEITNPEKDALPSRWKVSYRNQFSVQIGD